MTNANSDNTQSGADGTGIRIGRAAIWFAAGAMGATALTGVAMAATSDADSVETNSQAQMEGRGGSEGKGGPGGHGRRGGHPGGPGGAAMLHSEGVIEDKDGEYQNVVTQKGKVTAVDEASITVESEDGYSSSYAVNDDTKVHKDRGDKSISDIKVGDTVRLMAKKDGENLIAARVGATSPEQAAKMEKRREEMRKRFDERHDQHQNDQTSESALWDGPPAEVASA